MPPREKIGEEETELGDTVDNLLTKLKQRRVEEGD